MDDDDTFKTYDDPIAQCVHAAAHMVEKLNSIPDRKAPHYKAGLSILDALRQSIEPEKSFQDGKLVAFKGGKS